MVLQVGEVHASLHINVIALTWFSGLRNPMRKHGNRSPQFSPQTRGTPRDHSNPKTTHQKDDLSDFRASCHHPQQCNTSPDGYFGISIGLGVGVLKINLQDE